MNTSRITPEISVAGQIHPRDIPQIRALGFKSVICNRPDGEELGQPLYEAIATAAAQSGLEIHFLPVTKAGVTQDTVDAFADLWPNLPKPVLAYCRSGARSTTLTQAMLMVQGNR